MSDFWVGLLQWTLFGGMIGGIVGLYISYFKQRQCPCCGLTFSGVKGKSTLKEKLISGYTCPDCGTQFDPSRQVS